jgi:hypothetical protein
MISETMIHITEDLSEEQSSELLLSLGNRQGTLEARHHADNPHLLFVAFDTDEYCPHDLVEIVKENGLNAHLVDL